MKRGKRYLLLIAYVCFFSLFITAYFLSLDAKESSAKTIKIGCSQPLNISFGVEIKRATEICVDIINKKGGISVGQDKYKIDMIIYDDKYRPGPGKAAAERLIGNDRVQAIVGTVGSAPALAQIPVTQGKGIPLFTLAHSEKVLNPQFKYVYATTNARSVDGLYSLVLKAEPQIKTAVLAAQDDETGHALVEKASMILGHYGIKVLDKVFFPRTQRDYTPIATKVASLNPSFLAIPGFGGAAEKMGLMAKALFDSGWRGVTFVTAAPVISDLVEICTRGEVENLYMPLADYTVLPEPPALALKVRKAFEKEYGTWREIGPSWTLPIWFYVAAAEKAGGFGPAEIDRAMGGLEVETPIGKARMIKRPDLGNMNFVDALVTPALARVKKGKVELVETLTIDETIKEMEKIKGFKGQWE